MDTILVFIFATVILFLILIIILLSVALSNATLKKTLHQQGLEIENYSYQLSVIFDLLTHDMGNLLFAIYNINLIQSLNSKTFKKSRSLELIEESIFKVKFATNIIQKLNRKITQKKFVNAFEYMVQQYKNYVTNNAPNNEVDFHFISDIENYYIVVDNQFDILLEYLFFKLSCSPKREISISLEPLNKMIQIEAEINLNNILVKEKRLGTTGERSSLELLFFKDTIESLAGYFFYQDTRLVIFIPATKMAIK